jgi:hypothetical protein
MSDVLGSADGATRAPDDADGAHNDKGAYASLKIAAASIATISGVTPGNRAPAWAAGANSKPAFASKTIGAPQPDTTAANPVHPRRSSERPLRIA